MPSPRKRSKVAPSAFQGDAAFVDSEDLEGLITPDTRNFHEMPTTARLASAPSGDTMDREPQPRARN